MSDDAPALPDWLQLTDDESVLRVDHPSLPPFALRMAVGVVTSVLGLWLFRSLDLPEPFSWAPLVLVGGGLAATGWWYVRRWATWYVVTTGGIYKKTGVLSREVVQLRHDRVQTTDFSQSVHERLLRYGDVGVYTAGTGTTDLVFEGVRDPGAVTDLLSRRADAVTDREERTPTRSPTTVATPRRDAPGRRSDDT